MTKLERYYKLLLEIKDNGDNYLSEQHKKALWHVLGLLSGEIDISRGIERNNNENSLRKDIEQIIMLNSKHISNKDITIITTQIIEYIKKFFIDNIPKELPSYPTYTTDNPDHIELNAINFILNMYSGGYNKAIQNIKEGVKNGKISI